MAVSPQHRAAAAARLAKEKLYPLPQLREIAGASPNALLRWVVEGRRGVRLDAVKHPELGFCSSVEAVRRCLAGPAPCCTGAQDRVH